MRILQLCNKIPFSPKDGYSIAVMNLANSFSEKGNEVRMLAMNTSKHPVDEKNIPAGQKKKFNFCSVKVNNNVSAPAAFLKLLKNESYNVSRFISEDYNKELKKILKEFQPEIVQLEGLYLTPYIETIRTNSTAKIALRAHNVEHTVWVRNSEQSTNFAKKVYLKILAKQLKKYEKHVLNKCDYIIPISTVDANAFEDLDCERPIHICTASFDDSILKMKKGTPEPNSIFFIGTLDWLPNLDGLNWFLENVWVKLSNQFPELRFYIAGKNMPDELKKIKLKNVFAIGEVDNAYEFMNSKQLMVAPLFSGGGMRVKIIEAMALGKTIISTSVGAEGIEAENNKNIFYADDAAQFIAAISKCISDISLTDKIGEQAAAFAKKHFSASETAEDLLKFYNSRSK